MGDRDAERNRRVQARERLRAFMGEAGLSPAKLAADINAVPSVSGAAGRSRISRDSIRRFLEEGEDGAKPISPEKLALIYRYMVAKKLIEGTGIKLGASCDPFFAALSGFYDLTEQRVGAVSTQLEGIYEFYAKSENRANQKTKYFVRGAMRFSADPATGALTAEEWQGWEHSPEIEKWFGYYFIRRGTVVIILHNVEKITKFYILQPMVAARMDNGKARELQGTMVKIALAGGVFTTHASFFYNEDAFGNLTVIEERKVPPIIRGAF